jgi:hypothetical protein
MMGDVERFGGLAGWEEGIWRVPVQHELDSSVAHVIQDWGDRAGKQSRE